MYVGSQRGPTSKKTLQFLKRHGVDHICGYPPRPRDRGYWTVDDLEQTRDTCEQHGITLDMVALPFLTSSHIDRERRGAIMLGKSPERDRDIENINIPHNKGLFIANADDVDQYVNGKGNDNAFNIDQINSMVDNDYLGSASVSYHSGGGHGGHGKPWEKDAHGHPGDGGGFTQWAHATGGTSTNGDVYPSIGDDGDNTGNGVATADAIVNQEAFTQNIVMGANIQFNSVDLSVVGNDSASDVGDLM